MQSYNNKVVSGAILLIFSLLIGCLWSDEKTKTLSTGESGDLVVVMDSSFWSGETGIAAKKCFLAPQEGLPQSEALFNMISVEPSSFSEIFRKTRNIVVIEKEKGAKESSYVLKNDIWANNQLVLILKASSDHSAAEIMTKNCDAIVNRFQEEEWKRLQFAYDKLKDVNLINSVKEATGLSPVIPNDYTIAKEEDGFIWLRKDFDRQGHQVSMGIMLYRSPYDSVGALEANNIIAERNVRSMVVEGPVQGSYMSTYEEYTPVERELGFEKKYVKEYRGLWNMKGAFMGGPFVHYSFVDVSGKYLMHVDGYVFAPKFDKREYLRELEAIALSATIN